MTDPDPDAPLRAVIEAADRAEPRIRRVDNDLAMVHAVYQRPVGEVDMRGEVADLQPWSMRDADDNEVGIYWSDPGVRDVRAQAGLAFPRDLQAVKITDPTEVARLRESAALFVPDAKQRTRRDVAAVIT